MARHCLHRHSARPQVGHRGLGNPTGVARALEVGIVELRVERVELGNAVFVQVKEPQGASFFVSGRSQGLKLGVGGIAGSQLPPGTGQHPAAPGTDVPGQVRLE